MIEFIVILDKKKSNDYYRKKVTITALQFNFSTLQKHILVTY